MRKRGIIELEAALAVARCGSFRGAAIDLAMSPTAVGNAVANLEESLGVRLFNRTTRSVSLTEAGAEFVRSVEPALALIDDAVERINGHRESPRGSLRLNSSLSAAQQVLRPLVLEFLAAFPDVDVEIVVDDALIDIVDKGFDAGIRFLESVPGDMVAIPLSAALHLGVFASPAYLAAMPALQHPKDLAGHRCIRARRSNGSVYEWEFDVDGKSLKIAVEGTLTLDDTSLMRAAAVAGAGLAYLPDWLVADDLEVGRLVRVLQKWATPAPAYSLYYPSRRHQSAALRAFIQHARGVSG